jgi:hypothetical protein
MTARVTASKKAATKKPAPQVAAPAAVRAASAPFEPLRLSSKTTEMVEMVDLFEIDDVMYSVPRRPSANVALQYLDAAERLGQAAANLFILRAMLGPEGYEALAGCNSLTDEHIGWIVETIQGLVLGTKEAPKG